MILQETRNPNMFLQILFLYYFPSFMPGPSLLPSCSTNAPLICTKLCGTGALIRPRTLLLLVRWKLNPFFSAELMSDPLSTTFDAFAGLSIGRTFTDEWRGGGIGASREGTYERGAPDKESG